MELHEDVKRQSVNLYDVAKAAGVSHQTVSNVLNRPSRVRPETRTKVLQAISSLGYEAHTSARALGAGRSNTLGFEIPVTQAHSTSAFLDHFILPLAQAAETRSHRILMFAASGSGIDAHTRLVRSKSVDGVIVSDIAGDDPRVTALAAADIPFVAFGRSMTGPPHAWVDVDNTVAVREIVGHLADLGHSRVSYVDVRENLSYRHHRLRGIKSRAAELGLSVDTLELAPESTHVEVATHVAKHLRSSSATATIAGSDLLAATVHAALLNHGKTISPTDHALVSLDDSPLVASLSPSVTAVSQPLTAVIDLLIDLLIDRIDTNTISTRLLTPTITHRASA